MPRDIERWFAEERRRAQARERACTEKRFFATEAEARAHATRDRAQFGERLVPYHCDRCEGWHLTRAAGDPAPRGVRL
jgi:hypothetical protein